MDGTYYLRLIYELLQDYLPGISSALESIDSAIVTLQSALNQMLVYLDEYKLFVAVIAFTAVLALILKRRFLV